MASISAFWKSEKGHRPANEDACLVLTSGEIGGGVDGLYVVADGMGGRTSGAVASSTAVRVIRETFLSMVGRDDDPGAALAASFRAANDAVFREAASRPELNGMGTTCVAAAIKGDTVFCAHMGDSRAYLLRDGGLTRLTEDHSIVAEKVKIGEMTDEQARKSRFRNVITSAIGLEPGASPELGNAALRPDDVLLLCTDGLTTAVSDDEIADILLGTSEVREACDRLVATALRNGSSDNITVAVSAYGGRAGRAAVQASRARPAKPLRSILLALLILSVGVGAGIISGMRHAKKQIELERKHHAAQADLSLATYDDPVSLMYTPLQGKYLTIDRGDILHVVDQQGRLIKADSAGRVVYTFPARAELNPVLSPLSPGLASDRQGNLYLSNPAAKKITKFSRDGLFLANIGAGKLAGPEALTVDRKGNIFVVDKGRLKVIRVKPQPGK